MVYVDDSPRERYVPAGWPGMRGKKVVVTGATGSGRGHRATELPTGAPVTPHEVARTVVFLLSDWSTGVSVAHLPADGAQNASSPDGY